MKLQWLKFDINFFDDEKIKIILGKASGESIIIIWVRMLCMAMKSSRPGLIEIRDGVPYDLDELASAFNVRESLLRTALQTFLRLGMIDVSEGTPIEIVNFLSWQNIEGIERQRELTRARVQKYRQKAIGNTVRNDDVTLCNDDRLDQNRSDKTREDINTCPQADDMCKPVSDAVKIYEAWNLSEIVVHRVLDDKTKRVLKTALTRYTEAEILEAILNYATVVKGDGYYFSYRWTLKDFIARGLDRFVSTAHPLENFKKKVDEKEAKRIANDLACAEAVRKALED